MSKKKPLKTPAIVSIADFSVFKCCDIQGSHLIGYLWVSLIIIQSECLFFPFFLHWINPLLHWITWNCIYFNQSEVSNFPCILLMKMKRNKKNDTFHLQSFSKQKLRWLANLCSTIAAMSHLLHFITPILKSLVVPVIWLALIGAICLRIAHTIFCFKSNLVPSQWGGYIKNKTMNQISRFV